MSNDVAYGHSGVWLTRYPGSYVLLSGDPNKDTAIVFVHGFAGDSIKTWVQFQTLVDTLAAAYPWYSKCDLYFFKYSSIKNYLPVIANRCLGFIRDIFPQPLAGLVDMSSDDMPSSMRRSPQTSPTLFPQEYKNLVLVGHSLGGSALRAAVWETLRKVYYVHVTHGPVLPDPSVDNALVSSEPVLTADLCLFSPAHLGTNFSGWLGIIARMPKFGPWLLNWLRPTLRAYDSLQPDLPILSDIRKNTEEYSEKLPSVPALRARVLWGTEENVLTMWQYKWDQPVEYVDGMNHSDICKPRPDYLKPLDFVSYGYIKRATGT